MPYDALWESALNEQLVLEADLKDWIAQWQKSGHLLVEGLHGKQRVPQHGMGHVIVWKT